MHYNYVFQQILQEWIACLGLRTYHYPGIDIGILGSYIKNQ